MPPDGCERTMAMPCHLLAIIARSTLGLGFLGPLILRLIKKDPSRFIDHHGKEAFNFQLTAMLVVMVGSLIGFAFIGDLFIPEPVIIGILALVAEILACIASNRGEGHRSPCTIRFVH